MENESVMNPEITAQETQDFAFKAQTSGVVVQVDSFYLPEESEEEDLHLWGYVVRIENETQKTLQLKSRYCRTMDAQGTVEERHGAGVDGEVPTIHPGESFEYTGIVPLKTGSGFMNGCYDMLLPDGSKLQVDIPAVSLDQPGELHILH